MEPEVCREPAKHLKLQKPLERLTHAHRCVFAWLRQSGALQQVIRTGLQYAVAGPQAHSLPSAPTASHPGRRQRVRNAQRFTLGHLGALDLFLLGGITCWGDLVYQLTGRDQSTVCAQREQHEQYQGRRYSKGWDGSKGQRGGKGKERGVFSCCARVARSWSAHLTPIPSPLPLPPSFTPSRVTRAHVTGCAGPHVSEIAHGARLCSKRRAAEAVAEAVAGGSYVPPSGGERRPLLPRGPSSRLGSPGGGMQPAVPSSSAAPLPARGPTPRAMRSSTPRMHGTAAEILSSDDDSTNIFGASPGTQTKRTTLVVLYELVS